MTATTRGRRGRRFRIGVASRNHVRRGVAGAFAQLCHGSREPLARMAPGDWIAYYSPRTEFPRGAPCRRFTAIGRVSAGEPYAVRMGDDFAPYRRAVRFLTADEAPIEPLLSNMGFIKDKRRWGQIFRRGHLPISEGDFRLIAAAMGVGSKLGDAETSPAPNALPDPA